MLILHLVAAKFTQSASPDKYGYTVCGSGFDACSLLSLSNVEFGENILLKTIAH